MVQKELPSIQDVIQFAKENDFWFVRGVYGHKKCGCALTCLALMEKAESLSVEDIWNTVVRVYGSNANGVVTGFDSPDCENINRGRFWAKELAKAVTENKLWMMDKTHPV